MQRCCDGCHCRPLAPPLTCEIKIRAFSRRRSEWGPSSSQVGSRQGPSSSQVGFGGVLTKGPGGGLLRYQVDCLSLTMATGVRGITLGSGFWFSAR
ncbi:hypothetical protein TIFTF001_013382 [Ficus carica]|uniref:Uncharacterized protein n=1 Tax=Ficus carica TaxID=3494 RepID=A0AA88D2U2_FICCA|nr:hypothetical protein TIFTF001_013382 [Ficus carica]